MKLAESSSLSRRERPRVPSSSVFGGRTWPGWLITAALGNRLCVARGTEGQTGLLGRVGRRHCQGHANVYLCPGGGGPLRASTHHPGGIRGEKPRSWNMPGAPRQGWGGRSLRKERGLKDQFFVARTQNIRAFSRVWRFFLWSDFPEET